MRHSLLTLIIALFIPLCLMAQRNELLCDHIKTPIVKLNGEWNTVPCINLSSHDYLDISFDDLTHQYQRYRYKIVPMTWDWKPDTRLLTSEFLLKGIGDEPIEDYAESINTSVAYTHYSFRFPAPNTEFKLSGNYLIVVYDDSDNDVLKIPFMVAENLASLSAQVTTNTDIDFNNRHQQITLSLIPKINIRYPEREIHIVALQNGSPLNAAINPMPDFVTPTEIKWLRSRSLIFSAGNEFRKFELTTLRFGGMGIDHIRWFSPYYHATLNTDKPASNYIYDEDTNGAFLIKTIDFDDPDLESDYVLTHFSLKSDPLPTTTTIYVDGNFAGPSPSEEQKMTYNPTTQCYETTLLLKQGYYNYRYITFSNNGKSIIDDKPEGNFYQTENRYTIYAYYCAQGSRRDRLIAVSDFRFLASRK